MKFLCFAWEKESAFSTLPQEEWLQLRQEVLEYVDALREKGQLLGAHALQSVKNSATVRVRNGKRSVLDGPFAEAKETIGGFFLIEARDFEEALEIAAGWPSARIGTIEVRPVEEELQVDARYR